MIRVLQISDSLKQRFGITSFLINYNLFIDTDRVIFDYLILDSEKEIEKKIEKSGGKIYYMPKLGFRNYKVFKDFIERFFSEHKYSIVHSHFYQIDSIVKSIATKHGVKHYISHSHSTKYSDFKLRGIRNCIMSLPIRFCSTDFCGSSKEACDFLFGKRILNIRNKKVVVIPNAIDYQKFHYNDILRNEIRNYYGIQNKMVYGNVGSFKPVKNQLFLLDIFKNIYDIDANSVLMIVGDGDLREEIENKADYLGIRQNVILVGTTESPQKFYNAFDCYVFPSLYEGFGLSLLEAEVNGLPCVCSDKIPKEPIIANNVSVLSLKNTSTEWAMKCLELSTLGRRKEKLDTKYDLNSAVNKLMEFYEGLL